MYTHDSNQIEGNTLTFQETHLVVNEGMTISGKTMREHLEAINHQEAIEYLVSLVDSKEDLNKRVLMELHQLILKTTRILLVPELGCCLSRSPEAVTSHLSHTWWTKLMEDYFMYYERQKKVLHPVILAADLHERLAGVSPVYRWQWPYQSPGHESHFLRFMGIRWPAWRVIH